MGTLGNLSFPTRTVGCSRHKPPFGTSLDLNGPDKPRRREIKLLPSPGNRQPTLKKPLTPLAGTGLKEGQPRFWLEPGGGRQRNLAESHPQTAKNRSGESSWHASLYRVNLPLGVPQAWQKKRSFFQSRFTKTRWVQTGFIGGSNKPDAKGESTPFADREKP